jgi:uncharacterized protein (UPF0548 family)
VLFLKRPSPAVLDELLGGARAARLTYDHVGATNGARWPAGYHHDADRTSLGFGEEVFRRAVSAVRDWGAQRGVGIRVIPGDSSVREDETVLLLIRSIGLWTVAPCRVVYVREETDQFRFAYGTLAGHPEEGEESFAVIRTPGGEVEFRIESFSRPADPVARIAKPLTRRIQRRVTLEYLAAIRAAADVD